MVTTEMKSCNSWVKVIPCVDSSLTNEYENIAISESNVEEDIEMSEGSSKNKRRGNPFKRGNTWTFIYYVMADGKKHQKYKGGFATKAEAIEKMKETEQKNSIARYTAKSTTTVCEYMNSWFGMRQVNLKPNTKAGYKNNIDKHIVPALGYIKLQELSAENIEKLLYENMRKKNLSETTINYVHRVLNNALKDAIKTRKISENPCDFLNVVPKPAEYRSAVLTDAEYDKFIEYVKETKYSLEIQIAIFCGLRRGEILGIKVKDIDFDERIIFVTQQVTKDNFSKKFGIAPLKTKESRRKVPFDDNIGKLLKDRIGENKMMLAEKYNDNSLIFCNSDGGAINPDRLSKIVESLAKKIGKPELTLHGLRHICAERLLGKNNAPPDVVQKLLGHSKISTTIDIYCKNADITEKIRGYMYGSQK